MNYMFSDYHWISLVLLAVVVVFVGYTKGKGMNSKL